MRNQQSVHKGAWMPEVERPKFCRTQNKQSVHLKARVIVRGEAVDVLFERVVGMERLVGVKQSLCLDGRKV